jgi:hypothetical protein
MKPRTEMEAELFAPELEGLEERARALRSTVSLGLGDQNQPENERLCSVIATCCVS